MANGVTCAEILDRFARRIGVGDIKNYVLGKDKIYEQARLDCETELTDYFMGRTNAEHMLPDGLAALTDPPNGAAIRG